MLPQKVLSKTEAMLPMYPDARTETMLPNNALVQRGGRAEGSSPSDRAKAADVRGAQCTEDSAAVDAVVRRKS